MNRLSFIFLIMLSCADICFAQDSFHNPFQFSYYIELATGYSDSISNRDSSRIDVKYNLKNKKSDCSILLNGEQKYKGTILDIKLDANHQVFILDKFFDGKYNACLAISKGSNIDDQKIGMIYYQNPKEDSADEKTCYCLFLADVEKPTVKEDISKVKTQVK